MFEKRLRAPHGKGQGGAIDCGGHLVCAVSGAFEGEFSAI